MADFCIQSGDAATFSKLGRQRGVAKYGEARTKLNTLLKQLFKLTMRTQGKCPITSWMAPYHVQCADTNRAGRTKYSDILQDCVHRDANNSHIRATTGKVEVRLSMRSSTPPWPGRILLLSLIPALRLSNDS